MTLREAIREMVRWCQVPSDFAWCLRGKFSGFQDGILMAAHTEIVADQRGEPVPPHKLSAARVVFAAPVECETTWDEATRIVWESL